MRSLLPIPILLAACEPVPLPTDTGEPPVEDPPLTIASLRQGGAESGDGVRVGNLVLTTGRSQDGRLFYVQDQGGGGYSGARVRLAGTFEDLELQVGQGLVVDGTWFAEDDVVEIFVTDPGDLQLGDATSEPAAATVEPSVLAEEGAEAWLGVLVTLPEQRLLACPDAFGQVELDSGLVLDDAFVDYPAGRQATVSGLTAVLQPSLGEWLALPRTAEDLAGFEPGEGCTATVPELRARAAEGWSEEVELPGVVATSGRTRRQPHGFFVQQPGGGESSGLFVQSEVDPAVGSVLDLGGRAWLDQGFLVLSAKTVAETGEVAPPVVEELGAPPHDWSPWQGALVSLAEVSTTSDPDDGGECALGHALTLGSWFLPCEAGAGTTWSTATGLLTSSDAGVALQPRSEADLQLE